MYDTIYQRLDPKLQKALQSLGITDDIKIAQIHHEVLAHDLENLWQYFPEQRIELEADQLERLCSTSRMLLDKEGIFYRKPKAPAKPVENFEQIAPQTYIEKKINFPPVSTTEDDNELFRSALPKKNLRNIHKNSLGHAIRFRRSFSCYFGALTVCVLYPAIVAAFLLPAVMMFVDIPFDIARNIAIGVVVAYIIFLMMGNIFRCQVCFINIYSLRNFPRHRHAHKIPLIKSAIPTALSVIFRFWFRCPACGTAQKLFRKKGPRTHRSK